MPLLLHVGLPKTGTSSLQRLLGGCDFAVGYNLDLAIGGMRITQADLRPDARGRIALSRNPDVCDRLRRAVEGTTSTVIVSIEDLAWPSRSVRPEPSVRLRALIGLLDPTGRNTHIACGIRPAVDWIPSMYAQSPSAARSLRAFVRFWLELPIRDPRNCLQFAHLDDMLSQLVPPDRVTFLPLHEFGTEHYFRSFAGRTTLDWVALHRRHQQSPAVENVRREGDRWEAAVPTRLRGHLARRCPTGTLGHRLITSRWNLPLRAVSATTWRPRPAVRLDEELRGRIIERFGPSARELAVRRRLPLEDHGYW